MGLNQQYLGRFYMEALTLTLNDGTYNPTITIPAAYYYISGYTSEAQDQLVEAVTTAMAAETGFGAATCTYAAATGLVSFSFAITTTITFPAASAALKTILGYDGTTTTGASTYAGTNQACYVWRPSRAPSGTPATVENFWDQGSTSLTGRSSDGQAYQITGNTYNEAEIEYTMLSEADTITPATGTIYQDLEQFFIDVAHTAPMRIYPDRTVNTSTDFVTALWGREGGEPLGTFSGFAGRHLRSFNGLWDVTIPLMEHTETSTSAASGAGEDMLIWFDYTTTTTATNTTYVAALTNYANNFAIDSGNPPIAFRIVANVDSASASSATLRLRVGLNGSQDEATVSTTAGSYETIATTLTVTGASSPEDTPLELDVYLAAGDTNNVTMRGVALYALFDV